MGSMMGSGHQPTRTPRGPLEHLAPGRPLRVLFWSGRALASYLRGVGWVDVQFTIILSGALCAVLKKTPNLPHNGARPLPLPAPVSDNQTTDRDD